jgi:hypothetical protein
VEERRLAGAVGSDEAVQTMHVHIQPQAPPVRGSIDTKVVPLCAGVSFPPMKFAPR